MKKIGILGGTFNPIHNTHLHIALTAYAQYALDEVWLIPAGTPPHKDVLEYTTAEMRLEMVNRAIKPYPQLQVCDIEIHKTTPCYSWETLKALHRQYGDAVQFFFLMGEDSLDNFAHWRKPETICKYADVLVARRPGSTDQCFSEKLAAYANKYGNRFLEIKQNEADVSSTDLRQKIYDGKDVSHLLPESVRDYIAEYHLYQKRYSLKDISTIKKVLKKNLNSDRYSHTIGVMHTAANLAFRYEYPYENAMVAGLLHDCAKCLTDEERVRICKKHDIPMTEVEKRHPHLLHGKVGAFLAEEIYGVTDASIRHAIAIHTTGCAAMSLLDKIIFVADYIEPKRNKAPRLDVIRKMAYIDLEQCVLMILEDMLGYLSLHPDSMDDTTRETFEYYIKQRKKRGK